MKVRFKKLHDAAQAPSYASEGDAGLDLRSVENVTLKAGQRTMVSTGVAVELRENTVGYVCSRSGLAGKHGVFVLNAPGVVDSGYRGELKVILQNVSDTDFEITVGDRIAQFVIQEFIRVDLIETEEELSESVRGAGGFGSTGMRDVAGV